MLLLAHSHTARSIRNPLALYNLFSAAVRDCTINGPETLPLSVLHHPLITNCHSTPLLSSLLIHNTQFAPIGGCFQAPLQPNSQRMLRLEDPLAACCFYGLRTPSVRVACSTVPFFLLISPHLAGAGLRLDNSPDHGLKKAAYRCSRALAQHSALA